MARIDPKRRAEIGRERRARTRAQLVAAARFLFTNRPTASVTVEDVTKQARLAKGTFYSHFRQLDELWAAVAAELVEAFADIADASRRSITDPVEVIAMGCAAFIGEVQRYPAWGALIARGAWAFAPVAGAARERLKNKFAIGPEAGTLDLLFDRRRFRPRVRHRCAGHAVGERGAVVARRRARHCSGDFAWARRQAARRRKGSVARRA